MQLLNGQTGQPEVESTIKANKFLLKGKIATPAFKIVLINKQQPYITLFLDNSSVKIIGNKDSLSKVKITGSKSHKDYETYTNSLLPYQNVFAENTTYDSVAEAKALKLTEGYATKNPSSFIAPLAIIQYNQIATDDNKMGQLFNALAPAVQSSPMGAYVAQLISDAKKNAIGTMLPDFSQADTASNNFSLSSLKGKYVLIDFWASWCHPCRMENPNVVAAYNNFKNKNFTVLSVSLDKSKKDWVYAIKQDGLAWPYHVSDLQGWNNAVAQKFQIYSIPQNILIDKEGKIIGKNLKGDALVRKLRKVLR